MSGWFSKFRKLRARAGHTPAQASVPAGTLIYAIGDIHGRLDLLLQLEEKILRDAAEIDADRRLIICLGDYIDRGDNSYGVIEHLLQDPSEGFERICLIGNHEAYLLQFFDDRSVAGSWMANGGRETLLSYGVSPPGWSDIEGSSANVQAELRTRMPQTHESFLRSLAPRHRESDYFFVHAGVRPGVPLDQQEAHDLMWIRDEFLSDKRDHGAVIVHGHSIRKEPENLA
ncbi:MAG: serine/threonine protein phosphatase 1, partial [Alphaproteobacteria bacterium]